MAILPEPPARLSMITACPVLAVICAPRKRARMSVMPPGVVDTTILIGFDGYGCASAALVTVISANAKETMRTSVSIYSPGRGERSSGGACRFEILEIILERRL